jgi:lipopolysaccharide transport system ATP-binding protein
MAAIQNLCDKAIYLKKGQVQISGKADEVISAYLKSTAEVQKIDLADRKDRSGNGAIRFQSVELIDNSDHAIQSLYCGKDAIIRLNFERKNNQTINNLHVALGIDNDMGQRITQINNEVSNQLFSNVNSNSIDIKISKLPFTHGLYSFVLYSTVNNEVADWIQNAGSFHVESGDFYSTGKLPPEGQGNILINYSFEVK